MVAASLRVQFMLPRGGCSAGRWRIILVVTHSSFDVARDESQAARMDIWMVGETWFDGHLRCSDFVVAFSWEFEDLLGVRRRHRRRCGWLVARR